MSLSTTASHPFNYLHNSNYGFQPVYTIEEIRQRASINKGDTEDYPIKRWISTVLELYTKVASCCFIFQCCYSFSVFCCFREMRLYKRIK